MTLYTWRTTLGATDYGWTMEKVDPLCGYATNPRWPGIVLRVSRDNPEGDTYARSATLITVFGGNMAELASRLVPSIGTSPGTVTHMVDWFLTEQRRGS